jgi:hypothetical protein
MLHKKNCCLVTLCLNWISRQRLGTFRLAPNTYTNRSSYSLNMHMTGILSLFLLMDQKCSDYHGRTPKLRPFDTSVQEHRGFRPGHIAVGRVGTPCNRTDFAERL